MKKYLIQIALMLVACSVCGQGTLQVDQHADSATPPGGEINIRPGPLSQSFIPSLSSVGFVRLYLSDQSAGGSGAAG